MSVLKFVSTQLFLMTANLHFSCPNLAPFPIKSDSLKLVGWSSCVCLRPKRRSDCSIQMTHTLRGGFESDKSESRGQTENSIYAYLKGYGVTASLSMLTVIYSADTGSVNLGLSPLPFFLSERL